MAPLVNLRWEAFAQLVSSGMNKADAAKQCGYTGPINNAVWRLMSDPRVSSRIIELQREKGTLDVNS